MRPVLAGWLAGWLAWRCSRESQSGWRRSGSGGGGGLQQQQQQLAERLVFSPAWPGFAAPQLEWAACSVQRLLLGVRSCCLCNIEQQEGLI